MNKSVKIVLIVLLIVLDQITKLSVYLFMDYGSAGHINILGSLFGLTYVLNPGMAFGIQIGTKYGKLVLVIIRLIVCICLFHILFAKKVKTQYIKYRENNLLCAGLIMILSGAFGNTLDSLFYGHFLPNNLPYNAPFSWGYGQVIDMLDLNVYSGYLPHWLPIVGGKYISLFPVGNVADVLIMTGAAIILLFTKEEKVKP